MSVQLFSSCLVSATLSARMRQNAKVKKMEARLPLRVPSGSAVHPGPGLSPGRHS